MKKSILLLFILSISLFTISCSNDDNEGANTNTIKPKTLLVSTSVPNNTYVTVDIKDSNDNILETRKDSLHANFIFIINKGSRFTLTMSVPNQTFAGSYQLSEEYGNIILHSDSFTNHYNTFSATKDY